MNLTIAITIQRNDIQIGPNNGCPILYVYDSEDLNNEANYALTEEEFFNYLMKNNCFYNITNYLNTYIRVSYYTKEDEVKYINTSLQDVWTFDFLKENGNKAPNLAWTFLYPALYYIWNASFPNEEKNCPLTYDGDLNTPESYNQIVAFYNKLLDKFGDKLNRETFIQSVRSYLQRKDSTSNPKLTDHNITYIVDKLRDIVGTEQG